MSFPIPERPDQIPAAFGPPLIGPAANDLTPLPYPALSNPVVARWVPVHEYREYRNGYKEPFWNGQVQRAYRCRFTLGYPYLEGHIAAALLRALLACGDLYFAPYSEDGDTPAPDVFQVNLISELPDEDDVTTGRRPFMLELESVYVFTVCGDTEIPVRNPPSGQFPGPPVANVAAGMRVLPSNAPVPSADAPGMSVGVFEPCPDVIDPPAEEEMNLMINEVGMQVQPTSTPSAPSGPGSVGMSVSP